MSNNQAVKNQAINLRKKGFSLAEISSELSIAKSTASLWVREVVLNADARKRLGQRSVFGYEVLRNNNAKKRKREWELVCNEARQDIAAVFDKKLAAHWRVLAAQLYWCEGNKRSKYTIRFTNSDPLMISAFLKAMRYGFNIDDSRLRALLHLHEYHSSAKQRTFWSRVTGLPENQFYKDYIKPHTGKRKRDGYPGCISIRYRDAAIVSKLNALYYSFAKDIGA